MAASGGWGDAQDVPDLAVGMLEQRLEEQAGALLRAQCRKRVFEFGIKLIGDLDLRGCIGGADPGWLCGLRELFVFLSEEQGESGLVGGSSLYGSALVAGDAPDDGRGPRGEVGAGRELIELLKSDHRRVLDDIIGVLEAALRARNNPERRTGGLKVSSE